MPCLPSLTINEGKCGTFHCERADPMQKLGDPKIKIIHRSGLNVSGPVAPKRGLTFFGLFTSPGNETRGKNTATVLKGPVLKSPPLNVPRADLTAVKNWVGMEEKIVHDYKEQKTAQPTSTVPLPKIPAKQPLPAFETFSMQTAVSFSPKASKLKDPLRGSGKTFSGTGRFLLVLGWLAAGALVLLYVQKTSLNQEVLQRFAQLQSEKGQLEKSYAELKNASKNQSAEMKWLDSQLHGMALELKAAKADKVAYGQDLEKTYREERMRITVRYESELAALRGTVEVQNAIVNALKAQGQAFEKIIDQAGMSALSGAAAGLSREPFSQGGTSALQGEVISVNGRQGFVVINMGAAQGARSGRWITIFRGSIGLAGGRIDRVYPTSSVVVFRNAGMLQAIQEGDGVSFS